MIMDVLDQYHQHLKTLGLSDHTVNGYTSDLDAFRQWYQQTTGKPLDPARILPRDLIDYKSYLLTVKGY
jgi:site-specific recombinase XerD